MHQATLYNCALLHFDLMVFDITCDTGQRQEFKRFTSDNRPNLGSVDNHLTNGDSSFHNGLHTYNQRTFMAFLSIYISTHLAVFAQAARNDHISLDTRARTNEAIYTDVGGFVLFDIER